MMRHYNLDFSDINVKIEDALDMLHLEYDSSNPMCTEVEDVFAGLPQMCDIRGDVVIFDEVEVLQKEGIIRTKAFEIEPQKNVCAYMKGIESVAVFICTAGEKFTTVAKKCNDEGNYLRGFIIDTFGSLVVESAMDHIQNLLMEEMKEVGLKITNRYSPGYCLWPLVEQKKLFSSIPEIKSGISLTESCLMRPIKSVSGIIGIGKNVKHIEYKCDVCNNVTCVYRNIRKRNS